MTEQDIEAYLVKRVTELGCYCIKQNPSLVAGIPDELVLTLDGRCLFVELKITDGKLSMSQVRTQDRLKKMHHKVFTLWSMDDVDNFVRSEILYET